MAEHKILLIPPECEYVDQGMDSRVYKLGNQVFKLYYPGRPQAVIEKYMELTNRVAELFKAHPYSVPLHSRDDETLETAFEVTPIEEVVSSEGDRVVATSAYVPGPLLTF